jgi:hypothetical protein
MPPNKSLDASGGSVFLNSLATAEGALIRAAASTQPLGAEEFSDNEGSDQLSRNNWRASPRTRHNKEWRLTS